MAATTPTSRLLGALLSVVTAAALLALAPPAHALVRTLEPSVSATSDHFGASVAMDGDTLVVGAPGAGSPGAVYVFTRSAGETWTQSARLTASDGTDGDQLGYAVAIDAGAIVAGAIGDDNGAGAVYVFSRTGAATRTQVAKLVASDRRANDSLGRAVAVDGDTVVAGAPGADLGVGYQAEYGAVYTFATTGAAARTQTAVLTASDNTIRDYDFGGSSLGSSVAIDGDTIVAGAPTDLFGDPAGARRGSAYTFARTGGDRQQTAKLTAPPGQTAGRVGESVDVLGDTIVAGDSEADDALGAVWTFARTGAPVRTPTGRLTPANRHQNGGFGTSVSLSADFVAVGAPYDSTGGAGYVFARGGATDSETWFVSGAASHGGDQYGASIVTDGDRVVGGAPYADTVSPTVQDRGRVFSSTPDLFVTTAGAGSGTISSSPAGISACATSCTASYLLGDQVTLTATPAGGSSFAGWENYAGCSGTGTCVVSMTGQPQVVARFVTGSSGDTTPPTASVVSGPGDGGTVTSGTVTFGFTASETSTFQCGYDGEALAACTSPGPGTSGSDTRTLTEGSHTFRVRARDTAGNVSTTLSRTFTVDLPDETPPVTPPVAPPVTPPVTPPAPVADTTPPETTITSAPRTVSAKRRARVAVSFTASEPATFLCSVDGRPATPCTSPTTSTLGRGRHTIRVTAVDAAGNRDPSPAAVTVKVRKKHRKAGS